MFPRSQAVLIAAVVALSVPAISVAQMDHSSHGSPAVKPAAAMSAALEEGVVKKVDKGASKLSIAHEAQKNGMAAMTMVYKVKESASLDKLQTGQKIRFATDAADAMTIVHIESAK